MKDTITPQRILFVTGRLAEFALRPVLESLSIAVGFDYELQILPISVAALMHVDWIVRKLPPLPGFDRVIIPGWCQGDLQTLEIHLQTPVERGPKDLYDLPDYFGKKRTRGADFGQYEIQILAEINHAPRLSERQLLQVARRFQASGGDIIDLGCIPGESWRDVGLVTKQLVEEGFRVSIDSFDRTEVEAAVSAGAELVLSCNSTNRDWARLLPAELVLIPDDPQDLDTLRETRDFIRSSGTKYRLDPILEPIGFGFAESLGRYLQVRKEFPECDMMMGIGNVTELTEVDSAGINMLLASFCQEQRIHSVLTTEVIPWCRHAIREFDLARRLAWYSLRHRVLPKHLDNQLVMLRDSKVTEMSPEAIHALASRIKDSNFRVFVLAEEIHVISRDGHWHGQDPFLLFDQFPSLDASHAFYLGYEMAKAVTALTLGKQYRQDEPLNWGFQTRAEPSAHDRRQAASRNSQADD